MHFNRTFRSHLEAEIIKEKLTLLMPYDMQLHPAHNLTWMNFSGIVSADDLRGCFEIYATHPDAKIGQNLLNDSRNVLGSTVSDNERLAIFMNMIKVLRIPEAPRKFAFMAPKLGGLEPAKKVVKIWDSVPNMEAKLTFTESEALSFLGLSFSSFDAITAKT